MLRTTILAALLLASEPPIAFAQPSQASGRASVCVYHDRTYSEGAAICPQVRFMLMCTSEHDKLVWRAVTDRSLFDRCLAPTVTAERVRHRPSLSGQRIARTSLAPAVDTSAKCFTFNGKRYCE
jgi:hypothetical protein